MSDPKRTAFAMQALGLAETFNLMLQAERVKGPVTYRVELSAPDGMSTAGGKQATQHVKLVPEGGGSTIVAGSANQAENWAELRTFEHLKLLHAQRFKGAEIPLESRSVQRAAREAEGVLRRQVHGAHGGAAA